MEVKAQRQADQQPIKDVTIPSFYGEGFEEHFNKPDEFGKISGNSRAENLHRSLLNVIKENRRDLEKLNEIKKSSLQYRSRPEALVEIHENRKKVENRLFKRSRDTEQSFRDYASKLVNDIDSELDEAARTRQAGDIRFYVLRDLKKKSEKLAFAREAIKSRDLETLGVILTSKPYLTGLDPEDIKHLREQYFSTRPENPIIKQIGKYADHIANGYLAAAENLSKLDTPEVMKSYELRRKHKASIQSF